MGVKLVKLLGMLEGFAVMKVKSMIMECAKILVLQLGPSKLQGFVANVN